MLAAAVSSASTNSGASRDAAPRTASSGCRSPSADTGVPPRRDSISATAVSPPSLTSSMIPVTAPLTSPSRGCRARILCASAAGSAPSQSNDSILISAPLRPQALDEVVDLRRPQLVGDAVRDQAGSGLRDLLADLEAIVLQRPPGGHKVDDPVGQA